MKILKSLSSSFNSYFTHMGRARAREILLKNSDRMLEDAGLSRELLESGVKAWPWRAPAQELLPLAFDHFDKSSAMLETTEGSDFELKNTGITTGSFPEAVEREAIEHNTERKVA